VTFDSDAPNTDGIAAYIGTNNVGFGNALGTALLQLAPEGGKFGIISADNQLNLQERVRGIQQRLRGLESNWVEIENGSPSNSDGSTASTTELSLKHMREFAETNGDIKAIISCCGWPMRDEEGWKQFIADYGHIHLITGDATIQQLNLLRMGYGDALVGQLPYEMGALSIETLKNLTEDIRTKKRIIPTPLINHNKIPFKLPELILDRNLIGLLAIAGYSLFAIIVLLSVGFALWVIINRENRIVMASQPLFLLPLCFGTLLLGSAIIPWTLIHSEIYHNDKGQDNEDHFGVCMSIPWLGSIGFTLIFSMLFSKTWRVNQIFRKAKKLKRIVVKEKDVILPFVTLMIVNVAVLMTWTFVAPLNYVRNFVPGTDDYNRVLATYGVCAAKTGSSVPFIAILVTVNILALLLATVQAYQARSIETEFSEATYILRALLIMLNALFIGGPVFIMSRADTKVFYIVGLILVSVTCIVTLLFVFYPKIRMKKKADAKKKNGETKKFRNQEVVQHTSYDAASPTNKINARRKDESNENNEGEKEQPSSEDNVSLISNGEESKEEIMMSFAEIMHEENNCHVVDVRVVDR